MYGNPSKLVAHYFAFAGVYASTDLQLQAPYRIDNGPTAPHCASRSVEACEKAITCRIDLAAPMTIELLANDKMMLSKEFLPATVAHLRGSRRRADDIGEQNCGKDSVRLMPAARPG
jgi:hypothetical protein